MISFAKIIEEYATITNEHSEKGIYISNSKWVIDFKSYSFRKLKQEWDGIPLLIFEKR